MDRPYDWRNARSGLRHKTKIEGWFDVADAARELGLSEATVRRRIAKGLLPAEFRASQTMITAEAVEQLKQRIVAGAEPRDRRLLTAAEGRKPNTWNREGKT